MNTERKAHKLKDKLEWINDSGPTMLQMKLKMILDNRT